MNKDLGIFPAQDYLVHDPNLLTNDKSDKKSKGKKKAKLNVPKNQPTIQTLFVKEQIKQQLMDLDVFSFGSSFGDDKAPQTVEESDSSDEGGEDQSQEGQAAANNKEPESEGEEQKQDEEEGEEEGDEEVQKGDYQHQGGEYEEDLFDKDPETRKKPLKNIRKRADPEEQDTSSPMEQDNDENKEQEEELIQQKKKNAVSKNAKSTAIREDNDTFDLQDRYQASSDKKAKVTNPKLREFMRAEKSNGVKGESKHRGKEEEEQQPDLNKDEETEDESTQKASTKAKQNRTKQKQNSEESEDILNAISKVGSLVKNIQSKKRQYNMEAMEEKGGVNDEARPESKKHKAKPTPKEKGEKGKNSKGNGERRGKGSKKPPKQIDNGDAEEVEAEETPKKRPTKAKKEDIVPKVMENLKKACRKYAEQLASTKKDISILKKIGLPEDEEKEEKLRYLIYNWASWVHCYLPPHVKNAIFSDPPFDPKKDPLDPRSYQDPKYIDFQHMHYGIAAPLKKVDLDHHTKITDDGEDFPLP